MFGNVTTGQRLNSFDGSGSFIVNYGFGSAFAPNEIVLSNFLPSGLPGDFNDDGIVDSGDYTLWRDNLGAPDESAIANNGNGGGIDQTDYDWWRMHFGNTSAEVRSDSIGVPEPETICVTMITAVLLLVFNLASRKSVERIARKTPFSLNLGLFWLQPPPQER